MTLETFLALGGLAVALVTPNFALQRAVRPDQGDERIAGCCSMALPNEITKSQSKEIDER
jgi:hypothetical protein